MVLEANIKQSNAEKKFKETNSKVIFYGHLLFVLELTCSNPDKNSFYTETTLKYKQLSQITL